MSIGYACLTMGVNNTDLKSCMLRNADDNKLLTLISYNLDSLDRMIDYNIENSIKLFRISSDLIPFGSSPANKLHWWELYSSKLFDIGEKIKRNGIRVSMHPGQYTVLNSPNEDVVARAIEDINYHAKVLNSLGVGPDNKIVLHIGGIHQDKQQAVKRFTENFKGLSELVKLRLVLENDDKAYNISDVLEIAEKLKVPVIFDNLHNAVNPYDKENSEIYWIKQCSSTWKREDGRQKIHYSQQDLNKKPGSHSQTIEINEFIKFYSKIDNSKIDIMLEVKDKNLSAIKCINCTSQDANVTVLEKEWSKYKYTVLEHSHTGYLKILELLKNKSIYDPVSFYNVLEDSISGQSSVESTVNAAQHVWGYFKNVAKDNEKASFLKILKKYEKGEKDINSVKGFLWKMALKYDQKYLLNSYYFVL